MFSYAGGHATEFYVEDAYAFLIMPNSVTANGTLIPWVWFAPTLQDRHPDESHKWLFEQLLENGFAIGGIDVGESYGNPQGCARYQLFYEYVTSKYGLSHKVCLLPQSRGGLMLYNWAADHAEVVRCIGGIYTVCDISSWPGLERAAPAYGYTARELEQKLKQHNPIDRLDSLAKHQVPILHLHGDSDEVVPLEQNSGKLIKRYNELGGEGHLEIVVGKGHEVCDEFFKNPVLLKFFLQFKDIRVKHNESINNA